MIKLMIAGRCAPGKTRAATHRHLRDVHGPLVYDPPSDAGQMPIRYVQNHAFDGPEIEALAPYRSDRDLVTEIWFDGFPQLAQSTGTPYYLTVLRPDEPNFVDDATVLKGAMREGTLTGAVPRNAAKVFVFLKRGSATVPDFETQCLGAVAAVEAEAVGALVNAALPPPGGGEPYADRVAEFWFETRAAAAGFCERVLPGLFSALAGSLADGASFYVLADEYDVARLTATRDQAA